MIIMQSCPSVERACVQCSVQCVQCLGFYRLSVLRESAGTSDMTPVLRSRAGLFINIQYQSDLGRGNSKSTLWWRIHTLKASAQNIRVIQFLRLFKSYKSSELIIFEWSVKCQSQMYWTWEMWNIFCLICLKISLRSCHMSVLNIRCVLTCVSSDSWPSEGESWARLISAEVWADESSGHQCWAGEHMRQWPGVSAPVIIMINHREGETTVNIIQ